MPSVRFRVSQYIDVLEELFDVEFVERRVTVAELIGKSNEIIFLQKRLIPCHILLVAFIFKRSSWVYDFDDAIWENSSGKWSWWTQTRTKMRFKLMVTLVDLVLTSSSYLANVCPVNKTRIVPVAVEWERVDRDYEKPKLIVGWGGKKSSLYQLDSVRQQIHELAKLPDVEILVMSSEDPRLDCAYLFLPFSLENERKFYHAVDIGLVPSTSQKFDLGKTPVKALQHFAHSGSVIAIVPQGSAAREFLDESTAFLVENGDFVGAAKTVLADRRLLAEKALHANSSLAKTYSRQSAECVLIENLLSI